jgi:hypothetical protein
LFQEEIIIKIYNRGFVNIFNIPIELSEVKSINDIKIMALKMLYLLSFLSVMIILSWYYRDGLYREMKFLLIGKNSEAYNKDILNFIILVGCSWACFYSLLCQGYQGSWYIIEDIMNFKGPSPFQQRILFVLFAKLIRWVFPSLTYIQSYCLSQLLPIVLAFYFIKKWAELFIRANYSFLAQFILLAMLIPTITYYTFYDFGIIFFFTLCLYLLFKEQFIAYYIVFSIGIFNHEIILFMVIIYLAMYLKDRILWKEIFISILFQLTIFILIRYLQYYYIPGTYLTATGRIWINIDFIFNKQAMLFNTFVVIGVWYTLSIIGIKYAPKKLKRCAVLIPLLLMMTLFVGQLNELRQFNAYIPVAISNIMCLFASLNELPPRDSLE